ncbi:hypothetical protein NMY22_g9037 [Coprinellus aureogranulatus]|nr:hypothetical protein NMY22_g9037 [Coprinellus aureogranulatus]
MQLGHRYISSKVESWKDALPDDQICDCLIYLSSSFKSVLPLAHIALLLTICHGATNITGDFRNYFVVTPAICKIWMLFCDAFHLLYSCSCDAALALCIGALLQAKGLYLAGIMMISIGPRIVSSIISLIADIQYPAEPVSDFDKELGYPCYMPSGEQWDEFTIAYIGRDIQSYIGFVTTAVLSLLAGVALVVRYRGHNGRLVQVLRRDGGLYYIALAGIRFGLAIVRTPAILAMSQLLSNPGYILMLVLSYIGIPILAQRLMINLRKTDYIGSRPIASKLLFAPPPPGSEDDEDQGQENQDHPEVNVKNSNGRLDAGAGDSHGSASGIQSA